jgi:RNAse (barnase) inhibitor barstar
MVFRHQRTDFANALKCSVPAGISTKHQLLDVLAIGLHLPDYFGSNWDALDECLTDLSWVKNHEVVLEHGDLPLAVIPREAATYLSVLVRAVNYWNLRSDRQLTITFPHEAYSLSHRVFLEWYRSDQDAWERAVDTPTQKRD